MDQKNLLGCVGSPANVFFLLPYITDELKYKSKQRGLRSDYSIGAVWSGSTLYVIEASLY